MASISGNFTAALDIRLPNFLCLFLALHFLSPEVDIMMVFQLRPLTIFQLHCTLLLKYSEFQIKQHGGGKTLYTHEESEAVPAGALEEKLATPN
jgi:hypothetical protein